MEQEREQRIEELNREVRKCKLKNSLCSKITMIGSPLFIIGTSSIIIKNPTTVGAFMYTASALVGIGACLGVCSKIEDKNDNKIDDCINELHGYALEENKKVKAKQKKL